MGNSKHFPSYSMPHTWPYRCHWAVEKQHYQRQRYKNKVWLRPVNFYIYMRCVCSQCNMSHQYSTVEWYISLVLTMIFAPYWGRLWHRKWLLPSLFHWQRQRAVGTCVQRWVSDSDDGMAMMMIVKTLPTTLMLIPMKTMMTMLMMLVMMNLIVMTRQSHCCAHVQVHAHSHC